MENETLEQKVARLEAENTAANEKYAALENESKTEIERLSQEVDSAKSDAANNILSVKVGSQKYQVLGKKFNVGGKEIAVEDLIKDKDALKSLIEKESGILVPVN